MRKIRFILIKEFKQIFRNRAMLPLIIIMPIVQILVLSYAVDYEIKNLNLYVVDFDNSRLSRELQSKFTSSDYFRLSGFGQDLNEAEFALSSRESDLVLVIPSNFERQLIAEGTGDLQILIDAVDGSKAGLAAGYGGSIIRDYTGQITKEYALRYGANIGNQVRTVETLPQFRFNPLMDYKSYMVPGILVILVTMLGAFLSSMNIVREKELGTIEQINVTPIRKYEFILGKTIPFWIIGIFVFSLGLIEAKVAFNIPIAGSLWVLYSFTGVYLFLVLGFGLFISTITETQQQAMFISWFFLVIFILMGGLFTPIENMPPWAQTITLFNPIRYFIEVTRAVMLKGSGFGDLINNFMIISGYAVFTISLAVLRYRKTTG